MFVNRLNFLFFFYLFFVVFPSVMHLSMRTAFVHCETALKYCNPSVEMISVCHRESYAHGDIIN